MNKHQVKLGLTYYQNNYFNIGVVASSNIGAHNSLLIIVLSTGENIETVVNRSINSNGSVRFNGGIKWRNFVQDNYNLNDMIAFKVISNNSIKIIPNEK